MGVQSQAGNVEALSHLYLFTSRPAGLKFISALLKEVRDQLSQAQYIFGHYKYN